MTQTEEAAAAPTTAAEASAAAESAGFKFAPDTDRLREKWRRSRWYWTGGVLLVLLAAAPIALVAPEDTVPLSTGNVGDIGGRAAAEILRDHDIEVRQIARLSEARIVAPAQTTLVITFPVQLDSYQVDGVLAYPGDIVFLGISNSALRTLDVGLTEAGEAAFVTRAPACANPHAVAAESIEWGGAGISGQGDSPADVCFASDAGVGGWAEVKADGRSVIYFADSSLAMNGNLTQNGNAALVLRSIGANPHVVWYASEFVDTSTLTWSAPAKPGEKPTSGGTSNPGGEPPTQVSAQADFLPAGTGNVIFALALAVLVAALWLGRRMGPIVSEPLPVTVHASEATRGRARLYRRARAHGRASSALRASAARRIGSRLGVPRGADADALLSAISRVTGRSPQSLEPILYGPPPATDEAMMVLVQQLDNLESEVQRP